MVRIGFIIALIVAGVGARPVHPSGKYYVEDEGVVEAPKNVSTKWPTAEEKKQLRAVKAKVLAHAVEFKAGETVKLDAGAEVKLSDDGFGLTVEKAGDAIHFPQAGDKLTMHYIGKLKDGTVFDSSRDRGQPFQFTIGVHQVITGWDQGIIAMSLGERAMLHVPSYKGYGDKGVGEIPPNADLEFDVELLAINGLAAPGFGERVTAARKSGVERTSALWVGVVVALALSFVQ